MSSRRNRMSLGGGALRRGAGTPLLDSSSRFNSRSGNASDDDYSSTPHKSSASPYATRQRSSSVSRRESFGGDGLLSRSNYAPSSSTTSGTPVRDRRAMLAQWRQSRAAATGNGGAPAPADDAFSAVDTRKRYRGDPPLPPTSKQHRSTASTTHSHYAHSHSQETSHYSNGGTIEYYDDDMDSRTNGYGAATSVRSVRTPSSSRRTTMGSALRKTPLLGRSVIQSNREGKQVTVLNLYRISISIS